MGSTMNPWHVVTLDEFLFYCCPECDLKCQDHTEFFNHAVQMHELAKEALNGTEVKMELEDEVEDEDGYDPISVETVEAEGGYDILDESNLFTNDEESYEDINIDLNNIPQFAIDGVKKETLIKYKRSWREFLSIAKVKRGNEPTKEDVELYFNCKRANGVSYNTLKALYGHLNKMFKMIHNKRLEDFPGGSLKKMLETWKTDEPVRPEKRLTKAQIIQFLKEADDSDRYFLVRKVIAMVAFLGGLKLSMLRKMTLGSVIPHPKGYAVYIEPDMSLLKSLNQQTDGPVL